MHIATVLLGARSYELGSYKRQGQVGALGGGSGGWR